MEVYAHDEDPQLGEESVSQSVLLARVTKRQLVMFPLVSAAYRPRFLKSKYDELTAITILAEEHESWMLPGTISEFDALLEGLPTGFGRHAKYGLGLKWEYRLIPEAILEMVGITELVIEPGGGACVDLPKFRLGIARFEAIRRSIDAISKRANARSMRDRRLASYNETLHSALPNLFPRRYPETKPGEIYELLQLRSRRSRRSTKDVIAAARAVEDDVETIVAEQPAELLRLKSVIEQVTLKELIGKFEAMLAGDLAESKWQAFFQANPFILGLAFPYPVLLIQGQAHVGGTTISGKGENIADFLLAQRFTGNLAIIEIKRTASRLVESRPYRGNLHAPHRDLTSAIAQVLDQRSSLLHHFASRSSQDSTLQHTHVSAVHCIVIAGRTPIHANELRSLDLFRNSSKDVAVISYNELLEKLKELLRLVIAGQFGDHGDEMTNAKKQADDDLPF